MEGSKKFGNENLAGNTNSEPKYYNIQEDLKKAVAANDPLNEREGGSSMSGVSGRSFEERIAEETQKLKYLKAEFANYKLKKEKIQTVIGTLKGKLRLARESKQFKEFDALTEENGSQQALLAEVILQIEELTDECEMQEALVEMLENLKRHKDA